MLIRKYYLTSTRILFLRLEEFLVQFMFMEQKTQTVEKLPMNLINFTQNQSL